MSNQDPAEALEELYKRHLGTTGDAVGSVYPSPPDLPLVSLWARGALDFQVPLARVLRGS